jgi:hypothetical protein
MCFAPDDEQAFFSALRVGSFDAKAVCRAVNAEQATATEQDDKAS